MLLKNIILSAIFLLFTAISAHAYQIPDENRISEVSASQLTIGEHNFSCFRDLNCLKKENPFNSDNLSQISIQDSRSVRYLVEGSSENEKLYAVYNGKGKLIRATVTQRNILLPKTISEVLVGDEFKSWTMVSNEVEIKNFDEKRMVYKVVLSRDGEIRIEHFDKQGNQIDLLS